MSPDVKLERSRMRPAGMATLMRLCLLGLLVWGCASGPSAPPATNGSPVAMAPAPTEDGRVHVQIGFVSFERPAAWPASLPNDHDPINDGPLAYVSSGPLDAGCAVSPTA